MTPGAAGGSPRRPDVPAREVPGYPEDIRLSRRDQHLRTFAPLLLAAALVLMGMALLLTTAMTGG